MNEEERRDEGAALPPEQCEPEIRREVIYPPPQRSAFETGFFGAMGGCMGCLVTIVLVVFLLGLLSC